MNLEVRTIIWTRIQDQQFGLIIEKAPKFFIDYRHPETESDASLCKEEIDEFWSRVMLLGIASKQGIRIQNKYAIPFCLSGKFGTYSVCNGDNREEVPLLWFFDRKPSVWCLRTVVKASIRSVEKDIKDGLYLDRYFCQLCLWTMKLFLNNDLLFYMARYSWCICQHKF